MNLIDSLIEDGWLKTASIIKAFRAIDRKDFVREEMKDLSEINEAMFIGHNQTISQPLTVAFMMEELQPKLGDKILDIGSGSGWTTALLAHIVGLKGKVIAVEIIKELKEFGEKNASKYNFVKSKIAIFIEGDGSLGYQKESPFDNILASASAKEIPQSWRKQLKIGGRIVAPVGQSIWVLEKQSDQKFKETEHQGFVFVPLV